MTQYLLTGKLLQHFTLVIYLKGCISSSKLGSDTHTSVYKGDFRNYLKNKNLKMLRRHLYGNLFFKIYPPLSDLILKRSKLVHSNVLLGFAYYVTFKLTCNFCLPSSQPSRFNLAKIYMEKLEIALIYFDPNTQ